MSIDFNDIILINKNNESLLELYRGVHKLWNTDFDYIKYINVPHKNSKYISPSLINNEYLIFNWESESIIVDTMQITVEYSLFIVKQNKTGKILTLFLPKNIHISGGKYQRFFYCDLNIIDNINNLGIRYIGSISGAGGYEQQNITPIMEINFDESNNIDYIEKLFNSNINFLVKNIDSNFKISKFLDISQIKFWKELNNAVILKNSVSNLNLSQLESIFTNRLLNYIGISDVKFEEVIYNSFNIPEVTKQYYNKTTQSNYYFIYNLLKTKVLDEESTQDFYIGYDPKFPEYLYVYTLQNLQEDIEYTLTTIIGNINYKWDKNYSNNSLNKCKLLYTNISSDLYEKLKNTNLVGSEISINDKNYKIQDMNMCESVLSKFYFELQGIFNNKIKFALQDNIKLFLPKEIIDLSYSLDRINYIKLDSNQYKLDNVDNSIYCDILEEFKGNIVYFNLRCKGTSSITNNVYMSTVIREFKELIIQVEE